MKAIVFTGRNVVSYQELPDPEAGEGEVVVAVKSSGICHTDFEVLKANYGENAFPVVPGHEYAGEVVGIGSGVEGIAIGDSVVVDPNIECGACRACKRGWAHLCENLGAYGVTVHGGFAELSVVRASAIVPMGDISYAQAALAEPMGCVLNGVDAVFEPWMEEALIFGAGPMGVLFGIALKMRGVESITLADVDESRLALAESFGFQSALSNPDMLESWRHRADLAVDATGVPAVAAGLVDCVANGGKVSFFGVCPADARIEISPFEVFRRQLNIAGSHSLNHNIPEALSVINTYGPDIERIVSHRLELSEVSEILSTHPPKGSLKIQAVFD